MARTGPAGQRRRGVDEDDEEGGADGDRHLQAQDEGERRYDDEAAADAEEAGEEADRGGGRGDPGGGPAPGGRSPLPPAP